METLVQNKKPLKVMRVIARLNVGGPALHCLLLSKNLKNHGFETTLVTGQTENDEASFEDLFKVGSEGFKIVRLTKLRRTITGLGDLFTLWELIKVMRKEKPQIVHTHTAKAGVLGRIAAKLTGVPFVVHTFHGHVLSGYFNPVLSKCFTLIEKILAKGTHAIVTLSPALKVELSRKFKLAPESQFRIIPLGRELDTFFTNHHFKGQLRSELGIQNPNAFLIGIMGRLVPIKNHSLLLDACAALPQDIPWHLVVVGEGGLRADLENKVEALNLKSKVHFLGWRKDLTKLYADFDVFALSSKNEGTPLSIIESFASGVPVISTRVGGVADLFRPTELSGAQGFELMEEGALVESGNFKALSDALAHFANHPKLRKSCSIACRERAENFTEAKLTERVASLYHELAGAYS